MSFNRLLWAAAAFATSIALAAPPAHTQAAPARLVAIGDVHGAAPAFVEILQRAGIVDAASRWTAGKSRLVQTGDYLDRGANVREVLDLLMRLEQQASRAGGRVDVLFGNHEGMNLLRDFRDVSPQAFAAFVDARSEGRRTRAYNDHAAIARRRGASVDRGAWMAAHPPGFVEYADAFRPSGRYGRWLRSRKVVIKVNDTVFMHAGIAPAVRGGLDDVNRAIERELREWDQTVAAMERARLITPYFTLQEVVGAAVAELQRLVAAQRSNEELDAHVTSEFIQGLQRLTTIDTWALLAPEGPLWFRGYATWGPEALPQLDQLLKRFGAARFVVGHTPQQTGRITPRLDGRVLLIDTGMIFAGGRASALELQDGNATAVYVDGRQPIP